MIYRITISCLSSILWPIRASLPVERTKCRVWVLCRAPDNLSLRAFNWELTISYLHPRHLRLNRIGRLVAGNCRDCCRSWSWWSLACTQMWEWKSSAAKTVALCFCTLTRHQFLIFGSWCPSNCTCCLQRILKICSTGCLRNFPHYILLLTYWHIGPKCPSYSAWGRYWVSRIVFSWQYA